MIREQIAGRARLAVIVRGALLTVNERHLLLYCIKRWWGIETVNGGYGNEQAPSRVPSAKPLND